VILPITEEMAETKILKKTHLLSELDAKMTPAVLGHFGDGL
jgi:hypothetical protein